MQTTRTFVAVGLPEAQVAKLSQLQARLAPEVPRVRWASPAAYHVTLAFLGDVEDTELHRVCQAVEQAATGFPAFELRLEGLGAFPNPARARVLWVGIAGDGLPTLLTLQSAVAEAVAEAGYPADEKQAFRPHVTLGRMQHGRGPSPDPTPQINHFRTWTAGAFRIGEVVTFASTLTRDGPVYAPLARASLGRGKPRAAT